MALLTIKNALPAVKLSLETGAVPALVGYHGIGKTQLATQIAQELGWHFAHIDCCLLKEGELGGLPTVVGDNENDYKELLDLVNKVYAKSKTVEDVETKDKLFNLLQSKTKEISSRSSNGSKLVYATHHVLAKVCEWAKQDPEKGILLFLDEFNRCENVVMQECMNLVLNREINGLQLPDNVRLMVAMNPSNKFSEFRNSTYVTTEMDLAQLDRLRLFFLGGDAETWLDWATKIVNEETGETRIEPEICEFIASNPDALNQPESTDDIAPSSRSYERLSKTYKAFKKSKLTSQDLHIIVRGDLGPTVAVQFTQFLANASNPLIKPEEIFGLGYKTLPQEIVSRINAESFPRALMTVKNCIRYVIKNNKKYKDNLPLLIELITALPKDLMTMLMMSIMSDNNALHKKLISYDEYLDAFHTVDQLID